MEIFSKNWFPGQKCIFSIALSWPSFFELLSFLNGLSYRCQIGLKWKIIWCSFRKQKEKNRFLAINYKKYRGNRLFNGNFLQKLVSRSQNASKIPNHWSISSNLKNYIKLSSFWVQSGICSSNRLEMRATQRIKVMTM